MKKTIAMILALSLAFGIGACGSKEESEETSVGTTAEAPQESVSGVAVSPETVETFLQEYEALADEFVSLKQKVKNTTNVDDKLLYLTEQEEVLKSLKTYAGKASDIHENLVKSGERDRADAFFDRYMAISEKTH